MTLKNCTLTRAKLTAIRQCYVSPATGYDSLRDVCDTLERVYVLLANSMTPGKPGYGEGINSSKLAAALEGVDYVRPVGQV